MRISDWSSDVCSSDLRCDHARPHLAGDQRQDVAAMHVLAERAGLGLEQRAEGKRIDLAALEARPGIGMGIGGIDLAQEVARQAAAVLEADRKSTRLNSSH